MKSSDHAAWRARIERALAELSESNGVTGGDGAISGMRPRRSLEGRSAETPARNAFVLLGRVG